MKISCDEYCDNFGCKRLPGCPVGLGGSPLKNISGKDAELSDDLARLHPAVYAAVVVFFLGLLGVYAHALYSVQ